MLKKSMMTVALTALTMTAGTAMAGPFYAQTIASVEIDGGTQPWVGYLIDGSGPYSSVSASSSSVSNAGGTHNGASGSAWASSDLATGQLKTYAQATQDDYKTVFGQRANSTASARFGDSFTTSTTSGPFAWSANDVGSFSMHLDGVSTVNMTNPADINYFTPASGHIIWSVSLELFQAGTFASNFMSGGTYGVCDWLGFLDGSTSTSCAINGVTINITGDLLNGYSLTADVGLGNDFDWALSLNSIAYLMAPGSLEVDFGHTMTVGYTGPAGTTTTSASGLFPFANGEEQEVAEPETAAILALGLLPLLAWRRRTS